MLFSLWTTGASFAKHIDLSTFLVLTLFFLIVLSVISTTRADIPGPLVLPFVGNMMLFFAWAQDNTKSICVYIKHMATYFDCIWETYVQYNM